MRSVVTVLLTAVVVRLVMWLSVSPYITDDGRLYLEIAENLRAGDGISSDMDYTGARHGTPLPVMQEPVVPAFLAAGMTVGHGSLEMAKVLQAIVGSITCVLILLLARNLFGDPTGRLAGLLAAVYPPFVFESLTMQQEQLMMFFLVLAMALTVSGIASGRTPLLFLAGAALGLAVLTREMFLFWPLVLAAIMLVTANSTSRRRALISVVLFGVGMALTVAPWTIRNRSVLHLNREYERAPIVATWQFEALPLRWAERAILAAGDGDVERARNVSESLLVAIGWLGDAFFPRQVGAPDETAGASRLEMLKRRISHKKALTPESEQTLKHWGLKTYLLPYGVYFVDVFTLRAIPGWPLIGRAIVYLLYWSTLLGAAVSLASGICLRDQRVLLVVWAVLYVAVAAALHPTPMNRFFYPAFPFLIVLSAHSFVRVRTWALTWPRVSLQEDLIATDGGQEVVRP